MAESIAAFAIAGNVLQFLEAGKKFAFKAYDIVKSGSNSLKDLRDLRVVSADLQDVLRELQQGQTHVPAKNGCSSKSEARLAALSSSCAKVVQELLEKLDSIRLHDTGRRMDTVITAFRATWNETKILELQSRITQYRQQLGVDLLVSMRTHLVRSLETQEAILSQLKESRPAAASGRPEPFGNTVIDYVSSYVPADSRREEAIRLKEVVRNAIRSTPSFTDYGGVVNSDYPAYSMSATKREKAEKQFISGLRYKEMDMRESVIADAYEDTFRWILQTDRFDRKDAKLKEWLTSDSQLYWITGKAGSGKSTLMKFLGNLDGNTHGSDLCRSYLATWASCADQLILASFYFWAAGSSIVASQEGLFRALLVQLFQQSPNIIPKVATIEWEEYCIFDEHSGMDTRDTPLQNLLHDAVQVLVEQEGAKICFFIDGLDEFGGDPAKLISTLQGLMKLDSIKLCVSSRPWLVFEDAFTQAPNLLLQDFTRPDIEHFVTSELSQNDGFSRLQRREPRYANELIDNITNKSSGVFLWIRLVVKSLLAGLTHDDRISDLQRRLDLLPPDLEHLYAAITESLDPFYFTHAAQYFKFMAASPSPPSAILFSLADEENPNFALELPIATFTEDESQIRIDTVRRRINSRCKGLLEIGPSQEIQYLHRTVKDYLSDLKVQSRMDAAVGEYDCYLRHCSANIALIKSSLGTDRTITPLRLSDLVRTCLMAASNVSTDRSLMINLLDCLNDTLRATLQDEEYDNLLSCLPDKDDLSMWLQSLCSTGFVGLTARFGVVDYVRARASVGAFSLNSNPDHCDLTQYPVISGTKSKFSFFTRLRQRQDHPGSVQGRMWPLLLDANFCLPPNVALYRCLLEIGADPNIVFNRDGATVWTEILATSVVDLVYSGAMESRWWLWVSILQLLAANGARFDRRVMNMVMERLYRVQTYYVDPERLYVAFHCSLTGQEQLGLEYLRGEHDVRGFRRNKKKRLSSMFQSVRDSWS